MTGHSAVTKVLLMGLLGLGTSYQALSQNTGPLSGRPRRGPGPSAAPSAQPADLPPIETRKRQAGPEEGQPLFTADTNIVTVDVAVVDKNGNFVPNIPRGNFQVVEDGVPQKILQFGNSQAPMTVALVIEFSNLYQQYWSESWYQTLTAAYGFVETLDPEDWVAVVAYDLRPEILSDFTQNRRETHRGYAAPAYCSLLRIEPVRCPDRHDNADERHRGPQGDCADCLWCGHVQ